MMLEGKVAIVTGAGGGIGREIAIAMAAAGAKVVINDIGASLGGEGFSASPAEQTRAIIEQAGGQAVTNTDSVAEWANAQKIVGAALDAFGRVDIVVNNAGILRDQIFHRMTPEEWLSVINVHLNGTFFVSRAAAEHFRKQESGSYVHITSTSGLIGTAISTSCGAHSSHAPRYSHTSKYWPPARTRRTASKIASAQSRCVPCGSDISPAT